MVYKASNPSECMSLDLTTGRARCYCCNVIIKLTVRYEFTHIPGRGWRVWCGKCYDECRPYPWRETCIKGGLRENRYPIPQVHGYTGGIRNGNW